MLQLLRSCRHLHCPAPQVERDAFVLDFNPCVISTAQAFAIALTSFETKLLL